MTRYELLYIIPTSFTDDEVGTVETKVGGVLAKYQANVESTRRLGKFKLAYPIKHQRHGHYVMVLFTAERPMMAKIDEQLRITDEVLRHLILRADDAGSDQKFDLVQFVEVTVEGRDDRRRGFSRDAKATDAKATDDLKAGVAAIEGAKEGEEKKDALSTEDVDKKIDAALKEDAQGV
jgi:small subunit ribosomal protein S6